MIKLQLTIGKITRVLLVLIGFAVSFSARASSGVSAEVELELKITQKVKSIITPIDPSAIVNARIELKRMNGVLPGTNSNTVGWFSTTDISKIEDDDVSSIKVEILTSLDPFPVELKTLIERSVPLSGKKTTVSVRKMDKNTLAALNSQVQFKAAENFQKVGVYVEKVGDYVEKTGDSLFRHLYILVVIVIVSFAAIYVIQSKKNLAFQKQALSEISIKTQAQKSDEVKDDKDEIQRKPRSNSNNDENINQNHGTGNAPAAGGSASASADDREVINEISVDGILAILSDCYWCEKDSYASWIWFRLKPKTKLILTQSWPILEQYAKYFNHVAPRAANYHLDPTYLSPTAFYQFSQHDISEWLKKYRELWGFLSSMRKEGLEISLKDRVELAQESRKLQPPPLPETSSVFRELPISLEVGQLKDDDEEFLYHNPNLIKGKQRHHFHSLVWVAVLGQKDREKLLTKISAQTLAEIWIGPEIVLRRVAEALPEKKRTLLEEYKSKIKPSKDSDVLVSLSEMALHILEMQDEIEQMLRSA